MKQKIFQFAILYHEKIITGDKTEIKTQIISNPETILAPSEKEVGILAARKIDDKYMDKLQDIEILVRPF